MAIPKKIINFLEKNKIKYEILKHKTVYTAFDKARTLKIPEKSVGKTLILKTNRKLVMVLIPANKNLDLRKLKKITKAKKIKFASEKLIKNKFKGVKIGAIPPFGKMWHLPAFIDSPLVKEKEIIFSGGTYNSSIKIKKGEIKKLDFTKGNFGKARK